MQERPQPKVFCELTCENKPVNPNQPPIIPECLKFSKQRVTEVSAAPQLTIVFANLHLCPGKLASEYCGGGGRLSFNEKTEDCFQF